MKPEYKPTCATQRLAYLIEECGEVLAAAGKSLRWGLDSVNPELPADQQETNRAWLLRELADLKRAIARVEADPILADIGYDHPLNHPPVEPPSPDVLVRKVDVPYYHADGGKIMQTLNGARSVSGLPVLGDSAAPKAASWTRFEALEKEVARRWDRLEGPYYSPDTVAAAWRDVQRLRRVRQALEQSALIGALSAGVLVEDSGGFGLVVQTPDAFVDAWARGFRPDLEKP